MNKKKILIISALIFPWKGPRSYRATELAKEFARLGHEVTLCAILGKYDYSAFENEYGIRVRNLGKINFTKHTSDGRTEIGFVLKVLNKIFGKVVEFPSIELMFKVPALIKQEKCVDLLITIAVPYSIHWGAALSKLRINQDFPNIWIADCGDPYMGNRFKKPLFYFKYIEKWFCKKVDYITVPSENIITSYYPEFTHKIRVIPQGFKFDDVENLNKYEPNSIPTFAYIGHFHKHKRDPKLFLDFLCSLENDFLFIIYSPDIKFILPYYSKLKNKIEVRSMIERRQLLIELTKMDFLLNIENLNNYGFPSKLIDYALVKRPILNIYSDSLPIDKIIEFLNGNYQNQFVVQNVDQYNITNVANNFLKLVDNFNVPQN